MKTFCRLCLVVSGVLGLFAYQSYSSDQTIEAQYVIGAIICFLIGWSYKEGEDKTSRMQRMKARVASGELNADDELKAQIFELIRSKKKIEAIKLFRDKTNSGLKESKEYIEYLEATEASAR